MALQETTRTRGGGRDGTMRTDEMLSRGLGWFSIGLGLAEVAAPRSLARLIGIEQDSGTLGVLRAFGVREIGNGIAILTQPRNPGWLWGRVGGDAMDLAFLGKQLSSDRAQRDRVAAAAAAVVGVTVLDILCGQQLRSREGRQHGRHEGGVWRGTTEQARHDGRFHVTRTVVINKPAEELYRFWRNFENLPRFMNHLESVQVTNDRRSHWRAKAPAGTSVEWDAEITEDQPGKLIAWRSLPGADVDNSGVVRFERAPGGRGTLIRAELNYTPPGGLVGSIIARLFGEEPGWQVQEDLRVFKQVMETGEVTRSEATLGRIRHPAQPDAKARSGSNTKSLVGSR